MTVAVFVKVFDGIVLATDSATTIRLNDGSAQVYNNADKIFHLHRGLPIAAMTWGTGQIGPTSISTLAKDLRRGFMGADPETEALDHSSYTIEQVATRVADAMHSRMCDHFDSDPDQPVGMLIAGYSAGQSQPEAWTFYLQALDSAPVPELVASQDASGWVAFAQPDAANRLFRGFDDQLAAQVLAAVPDSAKPSVAAILDAQSRLPVIAPMPFPDAIALAKFLVEVTAGFSHFLLGPDTVGGPIEVAGVNRHEGFKWISRKHYYSAELNQGALQ